MTQKQIPLRVDHPTRLKAEVVDVYGRTHTFTACTHDKALEEFKEILSDIFPFEQIIEARTNAYGGPI